MDFGVRLPVPTPGMDHGSKVDVSDDDAIPDRELSFRHGNVGLACLQLSDCRGQRMDNVWAVHAGMDNAWVILGDNKQRPGFSSRSRCVFDAPSNLAKSNNET